MVALVRVVENIDRKTFEADIKPGDIPIILKGIATNWPAVQAARQSPKALADYIRGFDTGKPIPVAVGAKELKGRFFYNKDLTGVNYQPHTRPLGALIDWYMAVMGQVEAEAVYLQAQPIDQIAPRMAADLMMPLLDQNIRPQLWIGNTLRTQTHFDYAANIAVHVAGKKTFTLFASDQTGNLYPGPLDMTPAGVPISMASLETPDFDRFPRLAIALENAMTAQLEPGDGLFIPPLWWHHVQTTGPLNMLVNYWWNEAPTDLFDPLAALSLAALAYKDMPQPQREAWRELMNVFVFEAKGDPIAHLPAQLPRPFRQNMGPQQRAHFKRLFGGASWRF